MQLAKKKKNHKCLLFLPCACWMVARKTPKMCKALIFIHSPKNNRSVKALMLF